MHLLILAAVVLLGAGLRFWNLDLKPLWMDEVITALFSLGHSYADVPLEQVFNVTALNQLFRWQPTTCGAIAQTVSFQSVHPPLFFCWLHDWINRVGGNWVWQIRSLSAVAGVGAIVAVYGLTRAAFSRQAGIIAAIVMAVSPFAVYLSQEARHYTLPMLFITMALWGLIRIQQDLQQQRFNWHVWIGWIAINGIGFYIHYFFLLAIVAQVLTIIALHISQTRLLKYESRWSLIGISIASIGLLYLPWLPTFISHMTRPETNWLAPNQADWLQLIAPIYQLIAGWIVMTIALPVEYQSSTIVIVSSVVMLLFNSWLVWQTSQGLRQLLNHSRFYWETITIVSFILWVVLEFVAIVYILGKDITQVPRYNFIYYPGVCAFLAACLWKSQSRKLTNIIIVGIVGFISCAFVVSNLVFLKPYLPDRVAANIQNSSQSPLVVMAYNDYQDVALGLSFALALQHRQKANFAFMSRSKGYEQLWRNLPTLNDNNSSQLWIIAPGLKRSEFPERLSLRGAACNVNPKRYDRIGIPYQGYDCQR